MGKEIVELVWSCSKTKQVKCIQKRGEHSIKDRNTIFVSDAFLCLIMAEMVMV